MACALRAVRCRRRASVRHGGVSARREPERSRRDARDRRQGHALLLEQLAWPGVATFPGLPATAVPVGPSGEALPIGLQVIAGFLQDRTAIAIARGFTKQPSPATLCQRRARIEAHHEQAHRRPCAAARGRHALSATPGRAVPRAPANAHRQRREIDPVRGQSRASAAGSLVEPASLAHRTDELVYVLSGEVVLVTDDGEETLRAGDAAGFKANDPNGHHLQNRSSEDATFLEVGTRAAKRFGHVSGRRPVLAASPAACALHTPGRHAVSEAERSGPGHHVTHRPTELAGRLRTKRMRDQDDLFAALHQSSFRRRFALGTKERAYLSAKGLSTVLEHAREFVARRLAPALPAHDGRHTLASRTPGFHRPARNSNVLPRLPRQVARDRCGPRRSAPKSRRMSSPRLPVGSRHRPASVDAWVFGQQRRLTTHCCHSVATIRRLKAVVDQTSCLYLVPTPTAVDHKGLILAGCCPGNVEQSMALARRQRRPGQGAAQCTARG